jgi:hypothetical protein
MSMKSNSSCCGGSSTSPCANSVAELPRYYPRQLITPADLTLEQDYFRDRLRRHNRLLHGWGVVCGALVCPVSVTNADGAVSLSPWVVQVQPGYILGPYGDEILIDCPRTVDVRTQGVSGVTGETCIDAPDPWCTEVFTPPTTTTPTVYYIAVSYMQSMTRPMRVQPVGCGCDDSSCEYSRWHDGYQIGVLPKCPPCNQPGDNNPPLTDFQQFIKGGIPSCPDCSCGSWVGLAAVTVNADGTIAQIDNCSCRRLVVSFANSWWRCTDTLCCLAVTNAPVQLTPGAPNQQVIVTGSNLNAKATFSFPSASGVTVKTATGAGTSVTLSVVVASGAPTGTYGLTVTNPADGSTAIVANAITVGSAATGPAAPAPPTAVTAVASKARKAPAPPKG